MADTFHVGRLVMDDPQTWVHNGDVVSAGGVLVADTEPELQAKRQQLLGYVDNPDEPWVPIWADNDDKVDGFYRVQAASVEVPPFGHAGRFFRWSAQLERLHDYAVPLIQSVLSAPEIRQNGLTLDLGENVNVSHGFGLPASTLVPDDNAESSPIRRNADGPNMRYIVGVEHLDSVVSYQLPPADFLDGSARLELDYADDGTFEAVVGRQVPNLPTDARWRASNGILRVVVPPSASILQLGLSRWNGSTWSTSKLFDVRRTVDNSTLNPPSAITVLRNSPAEVVVRLYGGGSITQTGFAWRLDIRLQRGRGYVELSPTRPNPDPSFTFDWRLGRATAEAATAFDTNGPDPNVGIHATAADGDGIAYFMLSPESHTADTTNGRLSLSAIKVGRFAAGLIHPASENDGGAAPSIAACAQQHSREYFAAQNETIRLVQR